MKKKLLIGAIVLVVLIALYWVKTKYVPSCIPPRDRKKFSEGWLEDAVPSGDLFAIAEKYATPVIGGNSQENGSIVGGFFKGIDVYPSLAAAKFYQSELTAYLKSNNALPRWNISIGELLCNN